MESSLATILLQEGFRDNEDLGESCAHFGNTLSTMSEKVENLEIFDRGDPMHANVPVLCFPL